MDAPAVLSDDFVSDLPTHGALGRSGRMSGIRKAAILLVYLGEKVSAEVFKSLHDEEVKILGQEITNLGWVEESATNSVLRECFEEVSRGKMKLRELIKFEHPQTVAVILSHMEPDAAAEVVRLHPEETRSEVMKRLAQLEQVAKPVRNKLVELLASKLRQAGQFDQGALGGLRKVAEIFNRMDRKLSRDTLERIETDDPNLALSIRNLMFVFDDILLLTDNDMRKIIQRVDKKSLVTALKGTPEELREHFYRNMSNRAVDMLKEDMEALGPIRLKEVESARQQIVAVIREMDVAGEIDIGGSGGDQYVV
ncbi:MAG: flagellar motor switch protein FliG [Acidobacteriota bacterium]